MAAAARSGAELVAEAAVLVDGWAVLVDPLAGAVHSTPANAAGRGVHAALTAETDPALLLRPVAGAVLVIHPAEATPARLANAVARTTTALLDIRARRAAEMQAPEIACTPPPSASCYEARPTSRPRSSAPRPPPTPRSTGSPDPTTTPRPPTRHCGGPSDPWPHPTH
ncbi:hypothetical protein TPA0905_74800 [Streptomyces olivaceus]|nr:hypothetical protein TPA0905_74800 [Streptomyces olivaceus]